MIWNAMLIGHHSDRSQPATLAGGGFCTRSPPPGPFKFSTATVRHCCHLGRCTAPKNFTDKGLIEIVDQCKLDMVNTKEEVLPQNGLLDFFFSRKWRRSGWSDGGWMALVQFFAVLSFKSFYPWTPLMLFHDVPVHRHTCDASMKWLPRATAANCCWPHRSSAAWCSMLFSRRYISFVFAPS